MAVSKFNKAFKQLLADAQHSQQRRLLIIAGEQAWGQQQLQQLKLAQYFEQQLHISEQALVAEDETITTISRKKSQQVLGSDVACLVYDAYSGLDPDAIGVLGGAVMGGGLVILLTPELDEWHNFLDPDYHRLLVHPTKPDQLEHLFIRRFAATIKQLDSVLIHSEKNGLTAPSAKPVAAVGVAASADYCRSDDQRAAVAAIVKVVKGHRRRPLVLTSDRGRGKSTALGIAAAELMKQGVQTLLITAPKLAAVDVVFRHAKAILGEAAQLEKGRLCMAQQQLQFIPPDQLLRQKPKADVLLVDEAAAIPLSLLTALLKQYSRIVFASTVHGYEGAGRGFGLRFQQILASETPQWKSLTLEQPIRWQANDPVEQWLFEALLLNADYSLTLTKSIKPSDCSFKELKRRDLLNNEELLRQIFALLVLAHYQTTPADLRNLLDGPNIRIWVAMHKQQLVATALVTDEGGFNKELSAAVWKGERRLRGHLLPQTLAAHSGVEVAPKLRYQRIMRIAVQPELQQQGFGQAMLAAICDQAQRSNVDIVGSSFGVTADVLHFWQRAGFTPVRLGVSRDACSGTHSAIVLRSFNLSGELVVDLLRYRFLEQFPHQLLTLFVGLEPELAAGFMFGGEMSDLMIVDDQDWADITAFAEGYRVYEVCAVPLWKLACSFMGQLEVRQWLSDEQRDLVVYVLLQNRPAAWVCQQLGYTGRKELVQKLRDTVKLLSQQQIFLRPTSVH
ncbi:GNAT family N-acetyltransferase [Dasania sp. GY-MA-18]|uniref:tRNA(Met) cytidine acetyltransferase TmcA n=1 Tax=Dasania phycosphaerae TaxID=2950436 RepID=A0A9J6RIA0_9GAMM|nr:MULTISPECIES: GNAT family N-acetyltransferase [Dasania]MCR8921637.1 GNAT family N-acetyltransferase [Dasania sp. GY-MA-18]MCZ0864065.1 GNAT family N-acetyltransferase [Dasania phycosphaerae]MCZ0867793.1 GNAT family N-acetyltransferase [Dasania phycosphaerae]